MKLSFKINPSANFTKKELIRLEKARLIAEDICNSELFKHKMLSANFYGETSSWKNKSNLEIYNHFMSGKETLRPEVDYEADIDQDIFNPSFRTRKTVGYTYRTVLKQWINRKFFWAMLIYQVVGNIVHEWAHKLGFEHDFKRTKRRAFSVCYRLNKIIKECYFELGLDAKYQNFKVVLDSENKPVVVEKPVETEVQEPVNKPVKRRIEPPLWKRILFFWKYL